MAQRLQTPRSQGVGNVIESVAQEVAPFGIEFTLAEPGPTATNFGAGLISPPPMAVYDHTPAGEIRQALANENVEDFGIFSNGDKVARAMIDSVDLSPAPKRQVYGSNALRRIEEVYRGRLDRYRYS
ncbi:hypothetical protein [Salinicola peritrichatus]|uniref:hypothetical protein n=1 Tax=Salinicola peritrichatus TaxID=1267424 RepID=UPI001EF9045B|nr:hypothetical protein [Salinicola peritrichatus]